MILLILYSPLKNLSLNVLDKRENMKLKKMI